MKRSYIQAQLQQAPSPVTPTDEVETRCPKKQRVSYSQAAGYSINIECCSTVTAQESCVSGKITAGSAVETRKPVFSVNGTRVVCKEIIAKGTYGSVFKANFGIQKAAVKFFKVICEKAFLRECECLVRTRDCSHTLNVLGFGETEQQHQATSNGADTPSLGMSLTSLVKEYFIVTEYCGNRTLTSLISSASEEDFCWSEKQRLMLEMLDALGQIHTKQVCHHDIKPDNIIISSEGAHVKIADFGLSSFAPGEFRKGGKGTPAYVAPEAFKNEMDFESDIWSLGVCFYELLTRELPPSGWESNADGALLKQNLEKHYVPHLWQDIILQEMLCIDPKDRSTCIGIMEKLAASSISLEEVLKTKISLLCNLKQKVIPEWSEKVERLDRVVSSENLSAPLEVGSISSPCISMMLPSRANSASANIGTGLLADIFQATKSRMFSVRRRGSFNPQ